jgi:hypothetical protein
MNSVRMASEKWILSGLATMSVALVVPSNSRAGDLAGAVELYKEFIEGASKSHIDALQHDQADINSRPCLGFMATALQIS